MPGASDIVKIGLAAGFIQEYRGANRVWYQVQFPDGSWDVIPSTEQKHKHLALLLGAHEMWSERAMRCLTGGVPEP